MFDLQSDDGSVRKQRYKSPIPAGTDQQPERPRAGNRLDKSDMVEMHHRMLDLYTTEIDRQRENRIEQASDEDFYDNIQYDEKDLKTLEDRGQMPIVYNVVSASVDWVTGTEKRTRSDFNVLPRRKEDAKPAQRKTELMKYLSDVNRTPFQVSAAFEDAVKVGIGWIEDGIQDEDEDEPLYSRHESWRNMLWDSTALEPDCSDGRYMFRTKWIDLDVASVMFRKRKAVLERAASDSDDFLSLDQYGDDAMDQRELILEQAGESRTTDRITGYHRRRVRVVEAWLKVPVEVQRLSGGPFKGEIYDPLSRGHRETLESGEAQTVKKASFRMYVAIFTTAGMLYFGPSPYRHNRFPFTPIWAYRRGRDGMPYGMIRRIKDIQVDVNKRASKALYILSTNKTIMDEDALGDNMTVEEYLEEISRPDAVIQKKKGAFLEINADRDLSQWHLELMSRSISMIQQASGVTDENLGRRTNAVSGVAIGKRQDQGALASAKLFDNLLFACQVRGEKLLANIEQFVSEKKAFRITNMRGKAEFVEVNDGLPDNDIVRSKADFVIDQSSFHATLRQAAVEKLMEAMRTFPPEVALVLLDLVVENMDLPNREEIVKRIRAITNQRDPDAGDEPTPEEQAKAAAAAEVEQLQKLLAAAELRTKIATAAKTEAQADEIVAKTVGAKVDAQQRALDAAGLAITLPAATHVADHILGESGFMSKSDLETAAVGLGARRQPAVPPVPPQPMPPAAAPAPAPLP